MKKTRAKRKPEDETPHETGADQTPCAEEHHPSGEVGPAVASESPEKETATQVTGDEVGRNETTEAEHGDTIESLQAKVASLEDAVLRGKADFQNLQKRGAKERSEAIRYANAELMQSLLGVVDDFERALSAADSSDNTKAVVDGVRLVYENFMKALRGCGLEAIHALHEPFDPHVHEAVMQQPSEDHRPGTVIEEIARGYRLRERILRPTKVIVAQAVKKEPAEDEEDAAESTTATEGN